MNIPEVKQVITVWRDGTWKQWSERDATCARDDDGWLAEIPVAAQSAQRGQALAGWRPIETAPKDGTRFLSAIDDKVDFFHWQDFGDKSDAPVGWRDSFITVYREGTGPTNWMPLPAAPTP